MAEELVFVGVQFSRKQLNAARRQVIRDLGIALPQKAWVAVLLELYADGKITINSEDIRKYTPDMAEKYELI